MSFVQLIMSDKEKYQKGTNQGSDKVKKIFDYYESLGFSQVSGKQLKFRKLYNLVNGKINKEDYIDQQLPDELTFDQKDLNLDNLNLAFFPIIPNIKNSIVSEYDKKYIKYQAKAVNPENTNQVIENLNKDLRDTLIKNAYNLFQAENPDITEEEQNNFLQSKKIQDYYIKDYRTEIEMWANHTIKKEDEKFDMKHIAKRIVEQEFTTKNPTVHVNYEDGHYYPEIWNEANTFYLKSPMSEDYSDSMMVGYFNYLTLGSFVNKHAGKLNEDIIKRLEEWSSNYYKEGFVINGWNDAITGNRTADFESTQNYINFKDLERGGNERYEETQVDLIRETTIYFLLPRKMYRLYYKTKDYAFQDIVTEDFKVTKKPIYKKGVPKSNYSLIEGEHIETFYINELWKGVTANVNLFTNNLVGKTPDTKRIWLSLEKHDIQYSDNIFRYGIRIPVHGGSDNNYYNESLSEAQKCAPWQVFYNWIWNRNQQLLSTEVGKFLAMNASTIPSESMGESWGKDNVIKWLMSGRDTGLAPLDLSLSHLGQPNAQIHGGIGQVIDLTKTGEILEKAQLARLIKQECFQQVGLTEQYLFGDVSPRQSAASVAQGFQRSNTQIQHIFTRAHDILKRVRVTMLETAQHIESNNPTSQISYNTENGARVIFQTNTDGFLLHKLDIYVESNVSDADVLQRIKNKALSDNTLGTNLLESASIENSKSVPELMNKLKEFEIDKNRKLEEERQFQMQQQQQQLAKQEEMLNTQIKANIEKEEREHEKDIMVAQIRALGYGEGTVNDLSKEILELQNANMVQEDLYNKQRYQQSLLDLKKQQLQSKSDRDGIRDDIEERVKLKQLQQKDRELDIREKEVKASNKRTNAIND